MKLLDIAAFLTILFLPINGAAVEKVNWTEKYIEITNEIDLQGKTITLIENSIISFKGGTISNGVLRCSNTTIEGHNGICENVELKGTVHGPLDLSVFQIKNGDSSYDISPIINKAADVSKSLVFPSGTYYMKTPVVLSGIKFYVQYGDLIYNGKDSDVTVLKFTNSTTATISILGKVSCDRSSSKIVYSSTARTNITGIECVNFNNCSVSIGEVSYFNNNIKISGVGGGNCYNKYSINLSAYSNEHIRISQEDSDGKRGWCNENLFIGGRLCNWSSFDWNNCESYAIYIKGNEGNDSYDRINSLLFLKTSMEGFKNGAVYAKNAIGCRWTDVRTEGCGLFGHFVGSCRDNDVHVSFGTDVIDYSECMTYPVKKTNIFPIYNSSSEKKSKQKISLDTKQAKYFKVVFNEGTQGRVSVRYIKDNKNKSISEKVQDSYHKPRSTTSPTSYYYNKSSKAWVLGTDANKTEFVIPDDVSQVELTIWGSADSFHIYSDCQTQISSVK